MGFDAAKHAQSMRSQGFWIDKNFDEFLQASVSSTPDKLALLAYRADRPNEPVRLYYRELADRIARAAASLKRLGIGRGDVVSVQLPNWWESAVIALAAFRVGAVVNPLMPIFREHELNYMLGFAETKLLVVPKSFRGFDHEEMAQALKAAQPKLEHVIVVDGMGTNSFRQALLATDERLEAPPPGEIGALPPDQMAVLMFTSGTTGSPKGVMHCLNTLLACNIALAGRFGLGSDDTMLVCSPLGHMTGFAAGMLLGLKIGASVIFQDVWEPSRGVSIMSENGVTYSAGAATFLADMCEAVGAGAPKPEKLRKFLCAGAPIPPALIDRVYRELNLKVCSLWGMTESLSSTLTEPERALEKSSKTDGRPLDGVEVKIVRPDGSSAPVGETGPLKVRGAQMCLGYYKREDLDPFDAEGWFDTGDLAFMDDEGYIRITGAPRISSSVAARTCRSSKSKTSCSNIHRCCRPRSSDIRTSGWVKRPVRSSSCGRGRLSIFPVFRPTWPETRSQNSTGPSASFSSTICRARPPAKFRNSC